MAISDLVPAVMECFEDTYKLIGATSDELLKQFIALSQNRK